MAETDACCTCASLLNPPTPTPVYSLETEKPLLTPSPAPTSTPSSTPRRLPCCHRAICASCLTSNPRFQTYCPFCQVSSEPSPLPQGLRDPPEYSEPDPHRRTLNDKKDGALLSEERLNEQPPPYTSAPPASNGTNGAHSRPDEQEDVTHHLSPSDTIPGLSLAYHVPSLVLRTHNNLFSESLLAARKTLLIPRSHYTGPSLSPHPVDSEEETERKSAIRRFMVGSKCHEYEVAEMYLGQAEGDVEMALERWRDDERWERENPYKGGGEKGKGRRKGAGGGLVGQLR